MSLCKISNNSSHFKRCYATLTTKTVTSVKPTSDENAEWRLEVCYETGVTPTASNKHLTSTSRTEQNKGLLPDLGRLHRQNQTHNNYEMWKSLVSHRYMVFEYKIIMIHD